MEKLRDINAKAKSNGSSGQRFDYQAELAALTKEMHQPLDLESDRFNNFDAHDVCRKYKVFSSSSIECCNS